MIGEYQQQQQKQLKINLNVYVGEQCAVSKNKYWKLPLHTERSQNVYSLFNATLKKNKERTQKIFIFFLF